jgi:hypothetical protein
MPTRKPSTTTSTIPTTVTTFLNQLSTTPNGITPFVDWLNHNYANGHGNTSTTPSRLLSPYPTHHSPISITSRLTTSPELYSITNEDKNDGLATMTSISSLPKYLVLCARRIDMCIPSPPGHTVVLRCAIESGLEQLHNDTSVKQLIRLKKDSYSTSPGAVLTNEIEALNSSIKFEPPAPSGIHSHPPKRLLILDTIHARMSKLADELGTSKSLLLITCIAFGFHNQRELQQDVTDPHDHSYVIADHISTFDALVRIRIQMAQVLNKLALDMESRRERAKQLRASKGKRGSTTARRARRSVN